MASRVSPERGALAIVTNVGRDAVDVFAPEDERRKKRTAKSCGPGAPMLALTRDNAQQSSVTGESTKEPVKTIAQGRPDRSGEPVVTNSYAFHFCIRGCGCVRHPAFPAPSIFERENVIPTRTQFASRDCAGVSRSPARRRSAGRRGADAGR